MNIRSPGASASGQPVGSSRRLAVLARCCLWPAHADGVRPSLLSQVLGRAATEIPVAASRPPQLPSRCWALTLISKRTPERLVTSRPDCGLQSMRPNPLRR